MGRFSQINKGYNVPGICIVTRFIGYPHLDLSNCIIRIYYRKIFKGILIIIMEELCQEKMFVGIILIDRDIKGSGLCSTIELNGGRLPLLLRNNRGHFQLTELHLRFQTKESLTTCN